MSSQPLMSTDAPPGDSEESMAMKVKRGCRYTCYVVLMVLLVLFIVAWIIQGAMFYFATSFSGCAASNLDRYSYPGGESSDAGGPSFNLVPQISLLAERTPMWYGSAFDVIPSNAASNVESAPVGVWWQTWGPMFYTYTFEDVAGSHTTMYMRRKLLRLGFCIVIERCDGKGPTIAITEGSNWLKNRLRRFFRMNQGVSYKVWVDDELVAMAEETTHGFQSLTFRDIKSGEKQSSSVLKDRHFHGEFDVWLVNNKYSSELPYYVSSAATLLFAFDTLDQDKRDVHSQGVKVSDSPKFLVGTPLRNSTLGRGNSTLDSLSAVREDLQTFQAPDAPEAAMARAEVRPEHRV
eukprot:TRINITY_DN3827_c0_g5_i1.p1 TRINITY_DN3827_c0_g5~~TRINITY_DN3827_c0_g5_i1.p1  ORF type:complete len:349 (-),score=55.07 TRINITY_DN3827_c0_g5_i1:34-1080(-)